MKKLALAALLTLCASPLLADQVKVPVGTQTLNSDIELPKRSITKESVRNQFGDPVTRQDAVGEPPISSWEYSDFIVYFEFDRVLHSVVKRGNE